MKSKKNLLGLVEEFRRANTYANLTLTRQFSEGIVGHFACVWVRDERNDCVFSEMRFVSLACTAKSTTHRSIHVSGKYIYDQHMLAITFHQ